LLVKHSVGKDKFISRGVGDEENKLLWHWHLIGVKLLAEDVKAGVETEGKLVAAGLAANGRIAFNFTLKSK